MLPIEPGAQPADGGSKPLPDRRERLLLAAARCFAVLPFHAVELETVAREAGVGKGTIYLYFRSKELLYRAAVEHCLDGVMGRVSERARSHERIEAYLDALLHGIGEALDASPVGLDLALKAYGARSGPLAGLMDELRARRLPAFRQRLEEASRGGELRPVDPEFLLRLIDSGMPHLLAASRGEAGAAAGIASQLSSLLLEGLRPRGAAAA